MAISKKLMDCIQEQFENNPSRIKDDKKFAEVYMIVDKLSNIDRSINSLDSLIKEGSNLDSLKKLEDAWSQFKQNATLPYDI